MLRPSLAAIATLTLAFVVASGASSPGQTPLATPGPSAPRTPASAPVVPSSEPAARPVRIDAIVTDKQGKPIVNLRPSDFEIYENGVLQKIERVELTSKSSAASGTEKVEGPADEERAAREPGTRVIALYLDEFHVGAGASTDQVRRAVSRFVDEQLRPGDLVVVMKPLDNVTTIRFTRDRAAVRDAANSFGGRKDDYTPRTSFEQQYMGRSPGAVRAARAQIVISGLRALVMRIGELEGGRAALVLISEGFITDIPRSRDRRLPDLQGLVRAASRYSVALYALDPGAPPDPAAAAADGDLETARATLQNIAVQTGGEAVVPGQDVTLAMQRVSRDLDTYYVLTYTSSHAGDGRFYTVTVSSSRRDAHVRTRSGYWAPLPIDVIAPRVPAASMAPMRALRRSPLIESWVGVTVDADGSRRVMFTWTPALTTGPVRKPGAQPEVVRLTASNVKGTQLFDGEVGPVRVGSRSSTLRSDSAVFQVPPGRLHLDLVVLKSDGTRLDAGAQDIDLPDLRGPGPFILPPQLFRAGSAREFRDLSGDPRAAPTPTRVFRRTDRLLLRVPAHASEAVVVSASLKNRVGHVLRDLAPIAGGAVTLTQFDLPLAWLAPGEYAFELTATSAAGTARELIRFRITG